MSTARRLVSIAIAAGSVVVVAGCDSTSDGGGGAPTSVALSSQQASRLAEVLFANLESGGAAFTVSARTPSGDTMTLTGEVDWAGHLGRATVVATGDERDLTEIMWSTDVILERRPALNAELLDGENIAVDFVARVPSPASRTIDRLVAIIAALAGGQRDNPLLIAQTPGSASFGVESLRGEQVEILRYGRENRYWLDVDSGALVRFEQPPSADRDAIVIDIVGRGPQRVELPADDRVVAASAIADRYPFPL